MRSIRLVEQDDNRQIRAHEHRKTRHRRVSKEIPRTAMYDLILHLEHDFLVLVYKYHNVGNIIDSLTRHEHIARVHLIACSIQMLLIRSP